MQEIRPRETAVWIAISVAAFHLAYEFAALAWLIGVYLFGLIQLAKGPTAKRAFQSALLTGFFVAVPQLFFFFGIFNLFAVVLWLVVGAWTGLFVLLVHLARLRFGPKWAICFTPIFWIGIEYFRCEWNWLRFTWLIPGYTFAGHGRPLIIGYVGIYGVGFVLTALAAAVSELKFTWKIASCGLLLIGLAGATNLSSPRPPAESASPKGPLIVGLQAEFPEEAELIPFLDAAVDAHPNAELVVLSEYTFKESVPSSILEWCRTHDRHLIAGGRDRPAERPGLYYNTAFVVSPKGEIVFKQAKTTPIQFMNDGLPAERQQVWESPWGKIGICICYDLSYTRNVDTLIEQGAQLLIVPTMDVTAWGRHEHELHAKVGPTRAAEYGVPIVRVCSSGVSQLVKSNGDVAASLPFPGQGESFSGRVAVVQRGHVPPDRWLARGAAVFTGLFVLALLVLFVRGHDVVPPKRSDGESSLSLSGRG